MHSLTVTSGNLNKGNLFIDFDNRVEVSFGEFGCEECDYSDQYSKLQYILTMCVETEGCECVKPEEFYETDGFKLISDAVAKHCNCDGIRVKDNELETDHWDYGDEDYLSHKGYIDHQSSEDYSSVKDFLEQNSISSVEEFIFNDGVIVHTDNDNY